MKISMDMWIAWFSQIVYTEYMMGQRGLGWDMERYVIGVSLGLFYVLSSEINQVSLKDP